MILTGLIFIFFQLTDLAQEMRRQGVDIFPDCDSHCYIEGLPLKDIQTERHLYHCMALTANSLNFTWSRWNLLSGYDKLIMQYREKLPGAPGKKLAVFVIEIPMTSASPNGKMKKIIKPVLYGLHFCSWNPTRKSR